MQSRNERKWQNNCVALAAMSLVLATASILLTWMRPEVSPHQPMQAVAAAYDRCKAQAPAGFDCVMVPMLVSEQFIKEEGRK